jgi:ABC-type xylose transport system permease subunit
MSYPMKPARNATTHQHTIGIVTRLTVRMAGRICTKKIHSGMPLATSRCVLNVLALVFNGGARSAGGIGAVKSL